MSDADDAPSGRIVPVILSGGAGSRLWPLSRECYPKQFLDLTACGMTLLQQTAHRLEGLPGLAPPLVVCNQAHRFLVGEQLRDGPLGPPRILLEPVGRNTAPAVAAAALTAMQDDPEAVLLVLPADHVIRDVAAFREALSRAAALARQGWLATFGIAPTEPETGFGYIEAGEAVDDGPEAAREVVRFVEKPDRDAAEDYLDSGRHFWNSGMFVFRADRYLEELERFNPEMIQACESAVDTAAADLDFVRLGEAAFAACPSESIDYAVMERTEAAVVVPFDGGWNDLGSWSALLDEAERDDDRNALVGDVIAHDSRNNYVRTDGRLIALVGVQDHIVVETADAVLVAHRDAVQSVRALVERLRAEGRPEIEAHRRVHRPWGSYEGIANAERFQVKRIIVHPGRSLSLQLHHHRAEHWVVVRGTGRVTRGEESFLLGEDQSTYIPLGTVHRLENCGVIPLELVEVQTGSYLGEDDIVRYRDDYGRT